MRMKVPSVKRSYPLGFERPPTTTALHRRLPVGVSESFLGDFGKCDSRQIDYVQDVDAKRVGRDEKMLIPGCEWFNWTKD
jgi:hypothetical protein